MLESLIATRRLATGALTALVFVVSSGAELGPMYRGFRVDGQGRTGTASVKGVDALFLNPAGLAGLSGNGFSFMANAGLNAVLLDYAKWAADNSKDFSSPNPMDSLLAHMGPIQNKWAPFSNSFVVQGNYQDFALAFVTDVRYDLSVSKAVITPVPGVGMLSDL